MTAKGTQGARTRKPAKTAKARPTQTAEREPVDPALLKVLDAESPSGTDLVVIDPTNRQEVLTVIDRHDEQLIVEELQRRALKVMLYSFKMSGQDVTDLSYLGVNEAVRVMNASRKWRITVEPSSLVVVTEQEDLGDGLEEVWQATIYAVDQLTSYGQFGTYTQPKRMKLKDKAAATRAQSKGQHVDEARRIADKFSRQKAVNKAQRNGLRIHIPEAVRQTLIAQYEGNPEAVRRIEVGAGAAAVAQLPPPLTDERSKAQRERIQQLYEELREMNPLAVLPATYHAYLIRSEGSHQLLESFTEYLQDHIQKEQDAERERKKSQ